MSNSDSAIKAVKVALIFKVLPRIQSPSAIIKIAIMNFSLLVIIPISVSSFCAHDLAFGVSLISGGYIL
ncbi:Uncharacterised protein [Staphylococcus aureus]|nr:Uncharacterised protein [Staphylococcus aureus]